MNALLLRLDRFSIVTRTSLSENHQLHQPNRLIFQGSRLNMTAPAGVTGARQAGECGGMEPS